MAFSTLAVAGAILIGVGALTLSSRMPIDTIPTGYESSVNSTHSSLTCSVQFSVDGGSQKSKNSVINWSNCAGNFPSERYSWDSLVHALPK
jgi:hypothetical protein